MFFVLCALLVCFLLFDLWFLSNFNLVEVSGGSMENTLFDGDILYADRYAKPKRGDVVIIDVSPYADLNLFHGRYIIKRVIAMEGDSIKCEGRAVYLKRAGTKDFLYLDEPYCEYPTSDFEERTVGEGEIFIMGDHRTNSTDSRVEEVGCLKCSDVVGVVPEWSIRFRSVIGFFERLRSIFGRRTKLEE